MSQSGAHEQQSRHRACRSASPTALTGISMQGAQAIGSLATLCALLAACNSISPDSAAGRAPSSSVAAQGRALDNEDFADPFVLVDAEHFYSYATNAGGSNVQLRRSDNLSDWQALPDALPVLPSWSSKQSGLVWAPEVMKIAGRFVLYFTARDKASDRQCVGVAEAAVALGPFAAKGSEPLVCQAAQGGTIDASPFRDADGKLYLHFKSDGNCCGLPTWLYAQSLSADGLRVEGTAVPLLRNTQPWEGAVVEAPFMVRRDGSYTLFYSGNDYGGPPYALGYARCSGPKGPCTAAPENPILSSDLSAAPPLIGPGHNAVFRVGDQDWMAYHAWEVRPDGRQGSRRLLHIDKLDWIEGRPVVHVHRP
jgi:beta-xylosidase